MTKEEVQTAMLADVVRRFVNLKERTSRRDLMIKFRGAGANALLDLIDRNFFRRSWSGSEEEYLPSTAAFQFCGDDRLKEIARLGLTVVLHALQNMYVGEREEKNFTFEDLRNHINQLYPNRIFEEAILKLGLYLARDFNVLAGISPPDDIEITSFRIGEGAVTIDDVEGQWDVVTGQYRPPESVARIEGPGMADENSIKVFISHSSVDIEIAQALIELLRSALPGLDPLQIRCTSVPGYKLEGGADTNNELRKEMRGAKTFIGLLTDRSLQSTYVLFELGARWGAGSSFTPLVAAGLKMSDLKAPLSGLHAHSCDVEADLHQMLDEISGWLDLKKAGAAVYNVQLKRLAALSIAERTRESQRADPMALISRRPAQATSVTTQTPSVNDPTPNLVLVRVCTAGLIFTGREWRQFGTPGAKSGHSERIRAVFAEIKNAKRESGMVGSALGVKAELALMDKNFPEEFAPLAWLEHELNTVNFEFAETQFVLLAANLASTPSPSNHWVIPLNHQGSRDHSPGIPKMDLENYLRIEHDTRLCLNMLHVKTGTVIQTFEGRCVWRDGHSGPKITF